MDLHFLCINAAAKYSDELEMLHGLQELVLFTVSFVATYPI